MISLLKKKIASFSFSLFFIVTFTFFSMKAMPGSPFTSDQVIPEEILRILQRYYGLDQPLWKQFLCYLKGIATFDLGPSLIYQDKHLFDVIKEGWLFTFLLGGEAFLLATGIGIPLGIWAAYKQNGSLDKAIFVIALVGISIPHFVIATTLQYFLAMKSHLFPVARFQSFAHTILPAVSLSMLPCAHIIRLVRTQMIDILKKDYITTAMTKGASKARVLFVHALPMCLIPLFGYLTPILTYFFTGSFVVEKIFAIPGLGRWMIDSIINRDYPLIFGLVIFYSLILLLIGFLFDLLATLLMPQDKRKKSYA